MVAGVWFAFSELELESRRVAAYAESPVPLVLLVSRELALSLTDELNAAPGDAPRPWSSSCDDRSLRSLCAKSDSCTPARSSQASPRTPWPVVVTAPGTVGLSPSPLPLGDVASYTLARLSECVRCVLSVVFFLDGSTRLCGTSSCSENLNGRGSNLDASTSARDAPLSKTPPSVWSFAARCARAECEREVRIARASSAAG